MLLNRQRQLLALLDSLGGRVGNLDFQKLLFLYCQESADSLYDFVPYKFGAFSFTSYADRRKLAEHGLLNADEHMWEISAKGRRSLGTTGSVDVVAFARVHRLRGDALVADTYRRFPYYATKSEIAGKVLAGDAHALREIERARPIVHLGLVTIGYEGLTVERYLNRLLQAGVTLLCDVRRNPLSRKYGFSKKTLAGACTGVGIRYEHLPALGIAAEERRSLDRQADYDALFGRYEKTVLPTLTSTLQVIHGWLRAGESVALTCYEHLPAQCHRHCVAKAVERIVGGGLVAKDL